MMQAAAERLLLLCDLIPPLLYAMDEETLSARPAPGKWTKKEILGHLIDSATNNHHRLVRGQFEETPRISYDHVAWNAHSHYNSIGSRQLIRFWEAYNRQLAALIPAMPEPAFTRTVSTGDARPRTIAFLVNDYVTHLEHHLRQLVMY